MLGAVRVLCVGPTHRAASLLAAQGENLGQMAETMLVFGIGAAALPGFASALRGWRNRTSRDRRIPAFLGIVLVVVGAMIRAGFDEAIKTA